MDARLVGWARAVKSRRRHAPGPPPLWLFTDPDRMPDLPAAVRRLPRGLCGVVFRHDAAPSRAALARQIALVCRDRRLVMVMAGTPGGCIPGVGLHHRGGRGASRGGAHLLCTASSHGRADLVRARFAAAVFLSPALPTASHPGAPALGMPRWAALARFARGPVLALGGIDGRTARRLPRWAAGAGAIGALLG